jgi:hypothetical protein
LYALFTEVGLLGREPFIDAVLQLDVAVDLLAGKKSLQVQEQMKVISGASVWVVIMSKSRISRLNKNFLHRNTFYSETVLTFWMRYL